MTCSECREIISASLDGQASADELAVMEKHLQACSACESHRADLGELRRALQGWRDEAPSWRPSSEGRSGSLRSGFRPALTWGVLPALILAAGVGYLAGRASSGARHEQPAVREPAVETRRTVYPAKNEIHAVMEISGMDPSQVVLR